MRASAEAAVATGGRHGASAGGDFENFRPLREGHALRALEVTALFLTALLPLREGHALRARKQYRSSSRNMVRVGTCLPAPLRDGTRSVQYNSRTSGGFGLMYSWVGTPRAFYLTAL